VPPKHTTVKKILLVEDDEITRRLVQGYLEEAGYTIHSAGSLKDGRNALSINLPNLVILDVMLPDGNGFEFAKEVKQKYSHLPFVFLTSCSDVKDIKNGFTIGCEDYMKKPVQFEELLLRVQKAIGDLDPATGYFKKIGLYTFNPVTQILEINNITTKLGSIESTVLDLLTNSKGETICKKFLVELVWGNDTYYNSKNLDSAIVKLRKRLSEDTKIQIISIKRIGYKLVYS